MVSSGNGTTYSFLLFTCFTLHHYNCFGCFLCLLGIIQVLLLCYLFYIKFPHQEYTDILLRIILKQSTHSIKLPHHREYNKFHNNFELPASEYLCSIFLIIPLLHVGWFAFCNFCEISFFSFSSNETENIPQENTHTSKACIFHAKAAILETFPYKVIITADGGFSEVSIVKAYTNF